MAICSNYFNIESYSFDAQQIINYYRSHLIELCGVFEGGVRYLPELIISGITKNNIIMIYTWTLSKENKYVLSNEISLKDELYKLFFEYNYKRLEDGSICTDPYYYSKSYPLFFMTFVDNCAFREFIQKN